MIACGLTDYTNAVAAIMLAASAILCRVAMTMQRRGNGRMAELRRFSQAMDGVECRLVAAMMLSDARAMMIQGYPPAAQAMVNQAIQLLREVV